MKYNIGDKVWTLSAFMQVEQITIGAIAVHSTNAKPDTAEYWYSSFDFIDHRKHPEYLCFSTKEELLETIKTIS